jgi:lipopolysaccharide transport system permease protein
MLLLAAITTMGLSLWLAALYVPYRDVGYLLPFLTQLWMFVSPVIYPTALLPERFQYLYALNPLVVVIETGRWAFVGGNPPDVSMVAISTVVALVLFISGLWFFRRHEGTFADIV